MMRDTLDLDNPTSQELYDTLKDARGRYRKVKAHYKHYTRTFKVMPEEEPLLYKQL